MVRSCVLFVSPVASPAHLATCVKPAKALHVFIGVTSERRDLEFVLFLVLELTHLRVCLRFTVSFRRHVHYKTICGAHPPIVSGWCEGMCCVWADDVMGGQGIAGATDVVCRTGTSQIITSKNPNVQKQQNVMKSLTKAINKKAEDDLKARSFQTDGKTFKVKTNTDLPISYFVQLCMYKGYGPSWRTKSTTFSICAWMFSQEWMFCGCGYRTFFYLMNFWVKRDIILPHLLHTPVFECKLS